MNDRFCSRTLRSSTTRSAVPATISAAVLLVTVATSYSLLACQEPDPRITRIESGLAGPIQVQGREMQLFSLEERMAHYNVPGVSVAVLDGGRIGIGAISIGLARAALEEAIRYAKERHSFGRPLADHQAIQWMIADAATQIDASQLLLYRAAALKDQGSFYNREAAMAKLYATEMAEDVCRNAIQILGSYGYSSEYPVERLYRDARLMTIGEGTSEVQRMVIARRVLGRE